MKNDITSQIINEKLQQYLRTKQDRMHDLSQYSHARVGLGHTGGHLKSQDWLDFQSGFAQAKDALYSSYPLPELVTLCKEMNLPCMEIHSQTEKAHHPDLFLLRPDWGRQLAPSSKNQCQLLTQQQQYQHNDLLIIISGGLSPLAIQHQVPSFLPEFIKQTKQQSWSLAPILLNPRGRVALGDQLNAFFKARLVVMLIGERPGISTPDSMGIYITWQGKPGCTDDQRNCISNIHQYGLSCLSAVSQTIDLLKQCFMYHMSGVTLKNNLSNNQ